MGINRVVGAKEWHCNSKAHMDGGLSGAVSVYFDDLSPSVQALILAGEAQGDKCPHCGLKGTSGPCPSVKEALQGIDRELKLMEAIKKARGTLGYGPLKTTPKTIMEVRVILNDAINLTKSPAEPPKETCPCGAPTDAETHADKGPGFTHVSANMPKETCPKTGVPNGMCVCPDCLAESEAPKPTV